ncbi:hypothetical protein R6Q59_017833 [Mikania micrantha]
MANGGDIQRTSNAPNDQRVENSLHFKGSKDQTSPTFQQLLQRDGSNWSRISSQIKKIEDDGNRHRRKSVLAKVKEAAKRLKLTLRRKKDSDTNESRFVGPKDNGEDDAEYHSARSNKLENLSTKQSKDEHTSSSKVTLATLDLFKPHEFPQTNSRFSSPMVSTIRCGEGKSDRSVEDGSDVRHKRSLKKLQVSVKDYLMHKFEPGEEERALSKVITQTLSPRPDKTTYVDNNVNLDFKSKSLPTFTNVNTNTCSKITPIKQSYSLGSNASTNINQTFKSTFASYQDHFLGSSSTNDMILNDSSSTNGLNQSLTV